MRKGKSKAKEYEDGLDEANGVQVGVGKCETKSRALTRLEMSLLQTRPPFGTMAIDDAHLSVR